MLYEIRLLLTAVMFYTRIPVPKWVGYSPEQLNASTRYFPLIGWLVGAVTAFTAWGAMWVFNSAAIAAVLALVIGVLLTGAFHEDGFADVCDGFGGGLTRERTLEIMKDSRVGAYGVIGTVLMFALKIAILVALIQYAPRVSDVVAPVILAHVTSRWAVTWVIFRYEYARDDLTSKVKPIGRSMSVGGFLVGTLWMVLAVGLYVLTYWSFSLWAWYVAASVLAVIVAWLAVLPMGRWFKRRLGGYTGDCLGAAQQIIEQLVLLTVIACPVVMGRLGIG